jgi:hypothetical protein
MTDLTVTPSPFVVDTTRGSILHRWIRKPSGGEHSAITAYITAVVATYVPMMLVAGIGFLTRDCLVMHRLPFHRDWNVMFMYLVTFPTLLVLTVTDDRTLRAALLRIQADGILSLREPETARRLSEVWEAHFRRVNLSAYAVGVIAGLVVGYFNWRVYTPAKMGFWSAADSKLLPVGYLFLLCIFVFYVLVPVFVIRIVAISVLLRGVVREANLSMLPAHPDHCGGLRPVGQIGLRNQYALSLSGINVALLGIVSYLYLPVPPGLEGLIVAAVVVYITFGPVVFMGPLLPFRAAMIATKSELLSEVAQRLRVELRRLRTKLASDVITKDEEEFVDRLRKIGAVIDELPVWPFDAGTLKRFVTAYVVPLIGTIGYVMLELGVGKLLDLLAG